MTGFAIYPVWKCDDACTAFGQLKICELWLASIVCRASHLALLRALALQAVTLFL